MSGSKTRLRPDQAVCLQLHGHGRLELSCTLPAQVK